MDEQEPTGFAPSPELIERIADNNLDVYDNQDVPFDHVVDRVQPVRDAGRNPLFQIAVQLLGETTTGDALQLDGLETESILVSGGRSRFDLSFSFIEGVDRLRLIVEYATDLYDRRRVEAMVQHFRTVLGAAAADPDTPVSKLPLLTEEVRGPQKLKSLSQYLVSPYKPPSPQ